MNIFHMFWCGCYWTRFKRNLECLLSFTVSKPPWNLSWETKEDITQDYQLIIIYSSHTYTDQDKPSIIGHSVLSDDLKIKNNVLKSDICI